ncbi:hypothetical protein V499_08427 [Pseudogymnoascus sp. VKM F-103]|nr:hypothetical protein V499_08427 [Pseudogymnoascus sp. VKM F-103]
MCEQITLTFNCGCRKPSTIRTCGYAGQKGHRVFDTGKRKTQARLCDECYIASRYGFSGCEAWGEDEEEDEKEDEKEDEEEEEEDEEGDEEEEEEEDEEEEDKEEEYKKEEYKKEG